MQNITCQNFTLLILAKYYSNTYIYITLYYAALKLNMQGRTTYYTIINM